MDTVSFEDNLPLGGRDSEVDALLSTIINTLKRRARIACSFCQSRKIRCNVEELDCPITKTRRGKYVGGPQSQLSLTNFYLDRRAKLKTTIAVGAQENLQNVHAATLVMPDDSAGIGPADRSGITNELSTTGQESTQRSQDAASPVAPVSIGPVQCKSPVFLNLVLLTPNVSAM